MDISDQFQQVSIFLAQNGFVAILKKLTVPTVPAVKIGSMTCQYPHPQREFLSTQLLNAFTLKLETIRLDRMWGFNI